MSRLLDRLRRLDQRLERLRDSAADRYAALAAPERDAVSSTAASTYPRRG